MAPTFSSQQSAAVIDVSQPDSLGRSPTPTALEIPDKSINIESASQGSDEVLQVQETVEMVEDSYKGDYTIRASGHLPAVLVEAQDDQDLYSVSPETKSRYEATKLFTRSQLENRVDDTVRPRVGDRWHSASLQHADTLNVDKPSREATQSDTVLTRKGPSFQASENQPNNAGSSRPLARTSDKDRLNNADHPASPSSRRPEPASELSAVAALRSKRGNRDQIQEPTYRSRNEPVIHSMHSADPTKVATAPSKTKASQLPTPLTNGAAHRDQGKRPSTGKLPTHNVKASAARLSIVPPATAKGPKRESAWPGGSGDEYDESHGTKRPKSAFYGQQVMKKQVHANAKTKEPAASISGKDGAESKYGTGRKLPGTLKRPIHLSGGAKVARNQKDVYEVSDASDGASKSQKQRKQRLPKSAKLPTSQANIVSRTRDRTQESPSPHRNDTRPSIRHGPTQRKMLLHAAPNSFNTQDQGGKTRKQSLSHTRQPGGRNKLDDQPSRAVEDPSPHQYPTDPNAAGGAVQSDQFHKLAEAQAPPGQFLAMAREKMRGSQEHPIDLSESVTSSSEPLRVDGFLVPEPEPTHKRLTNERYRTPAYMPSSPPGARTGSRSAKESGKPNIIGWTKSGPRNQGSERRVQNRPLVKGSAGLFGTPQASQFGSSLAGSQTKRPMQASGNPPGQKKVAGVLTQDDPRGNVAGKHESILEAFGLTREPASSNADNHVADARRPTSAANGSISSKMLLTTRSQVSARPEKHKSLTSGPGTSRQDPGCVSGDDGVGHLTTLDDDFDGTTVLENESQLGDVVLPPTASQIAMPPPVGEGRKIVKMQPAPTVLEMVSTTSTVGSAPRASHSTKSKRKLEDVAVDDDRGPQKRKKPETQAKTLRSSVLGEEAGRKELPIPESASVKPQANLSIASSEPAIRATRRQSKPMRQYSQPRIDVLGSPAPRGMEVPARMTVLEIYAQQNMSADRTDREDPLTAACHDNVLTPFRGMPYLAVPAGSTGSISSKSKPLPADPRASTPKGHSKVTRDLVDQLVRRNQMREPLTDPFTNSKDSQEVVSSHQLESAFMAQMRLQGIATAEPLEKKGAPVAHDVRGSGASIKPGAVDENENQENEDPDKTLVEPESPAQPGPKQRLSGSSEGSPSVPQPTKKADVRYHDMGLWREALKPHQMTLFDSLVLVSHKLVRTLVDSETAVKDMVNDYRKQGEIIVGTLENTQAAAYQDLLRNSKQNKLDVADKLAKSGRRLKWAMYAGVEGQGEHTRSARSAGVIEDQLNVMMESVC